MVGPDTLIDSKSIVYLSKGIWRKQLHRLPDSRFGVIVFYVALQGTAIPNRWSKAFFASPEIAWLFYDAITSLDMAKEYLDLEQ